MVQKYQLMNPNFQKEISAVIEKDVSLKDEITQLQKSDCDCENENSTQWTFPILCLLLYPVAICALILWGLLGIFPLGIIWFIGFILQCFWWNPYKKY